MGFIRKSDAEEMLTRFSTGTFLLRFSDSELGGLTVAWAGCKFAHITILITYQEGTELLFIFCKIKHILSSNYYDKHILDY